MQFLCVKGWEVWGAGVGSSLGSKGPFGVFWVVY